MTTTEQLNWNDLCPDGALRYYEGDDLEGFAAEMQAIGIDVRAPIPDGRLTWGDLVEPMGWEPFEFEPFTYYGFWIPAGRVEEIYGSDRWPLGS